MIKYSKFILILTLIFGLSSCSEYRKVLKTEGYEKKLEAAMKYYEDEEYFKASTLFKDIKPLVKGSEEVGNKIGDFLKSKSSIIDSFSIISL